MKTYELKIGNLVKCKTSNDSGIYTVLALDGLNLKVYLSEPRSKWHTEDLIKPIPLTEEWLLKFGYTEEDFETGKIIIVTENNKLIGFIINKYSYSPIIKYVHQLQNLYFALTGTELILNQ